MTDEPSAVVAIDYTNHRGERARRRIVPMWIRFTSGDWHAGPQWIMEAVDLDRSAVRSFALKDVHSWTPE